MRWFRFAGLGLVFLAATALPGCGRSSSTSPSKIKVGFVTNNPHEFWTIAEAGTKKAGDELIKEMKVQVRTLDDLLLQSEVIRFEVVDAQRADYEFKAKGEVVDAGTERKIDFATDPKVIYWPFNGEFWRDELGYYRYTEHGSCN